MCTSVKLRYMERMDALRTDNTHRLMRWVASHYPRPPASDDSDNSDSSSKKYILPPESSQVPKQSFTRFKISSFVAEGAVGTVYRGTCDDIPIVLKVANAGQEEVLRKEVDLIQNKLGDLLGVAIPANFGLISDEVYEGTLMEDVGNPIESLLDLTLPDR